MPFGYHDLVSLDAICDRRLLILSGKGGVGKTTVSAALGTLATRHDLKVLLVEVEGRSALSNLFGGPVLGSGPRELRPGLYGMNISPEEALKEYLEVQFHMKRVLRPLITSHLVEYATHAAPGLRDILMLGKVWHLATRRREFDLLILDTPASGHAVSMLRSPEGFLHAVPIGRLASHARGVMEWLRDPEQVAVHLVTVAEEMPVSETLETVRRLERQLATEVDQIYVNMLYPPPGEDPSFEEVFSRLGGPGDLREAVAAAGGSLKVAAARRLFAAGSFYRARRAQQLEHRNELISSLGAPASIVELPFLFRPSFGAKEIEHLADVIEHRIAERVAG
ncbi:MAG: ArsA family ATPase [Actinomycetota bacterium]